MPLQLFRPDDRLELSDADLVTYQAGITDGDPSTTYIVRIIGMEELRTLRQKYVQWRLNRQTHQREEYIDPVAAQRFADELIEKILLDWQGVTYQDAPAPCTEEFRRLLDPMRKAALISAATSSHVQSPEDLAASFRRPADVRGVVE